MKCEHILHRHFTLTKTQEKRKSSSDCFSVMWSFFFKSREKKNGNFSFLVYPYRSSRTLSEILTTLYNILGRERSFLFRWTGRRPSTEVVEHCLESLSMYYGSFMISPISVGERVGIFLVNPDQVWLHLWFQRYKELLRSSSIKISSAEHMHFQLSTQMEVVSWKGNATW